MWLQCCWPLVAREMKTAMQLFCSNLDRVDEVVTMADYSFTGACFHS